MEEDTVILPGLHAIKHALRFGAAISKVFVLDKSAAGKLVREIAPDVADQLLHLAEEITAHEFKQRFGELHPTGIAALAQKPVVSTPPFQQENRSAPAILLENPRRTGNVGAVIRVAAAAGSSGVMTTGEMDPWHPEVIRGSAGLHFALPVMKLDGTSKLQGPIIVLDPDGDDISITGIPANAVLAFGTERSGVSVRLRKQADVLMSIPMRAGVSSLNLATSVAVALYYWRLSQPSKG
jgi:RNA methyltransferase, TrmH family